MLHPSHLCHVMTTFADPLPGFPASGAMAQFDRLTETGARQDQESHLVVSYREKS
jgi:hypothetical protein